MPVEKILSPRFEVCAKVTYVEADSRPEENLFFFTYKITIKNKSAFPAQLMSRHWIITDSFGQTDEVRGAGVVGLQPKIAAGESFDYESACPLQTSSGSMKGTFQMLATSGETFDITVPEFYLIAPMSLH